MRRRASASRRSRSPSRSACWSSTWRKRRKSPSRRCSSIPRSCGRPRSARPTRRAACQHSGILRRGRAAGVGARPRPRPRRQGSREVLAEGLLATVLQHEIDHLDGVLFIDHISKLKRDRVIKKFAEGRQARRRRLARAVSEPGAGFTSLREHAHATRCASRSWHRWGRHGRQLAGQGFSALGLEPHARQGAGAGRQGRQSRGDAARSRGRAPTSSSPWWRTTTPRAPSGSGPTARWPERRPARSSSNRAR